MNQWSRECPQRHKSSSPAVTLHQTRFESTGRNCWTPGPTCRPHPNIEARCSLTRWRHSRYSMVACYVQALIMRMYEIRYNCSAWEAKVELNNYLFKRIMAHAIMSGHVWLVTNLCYDVGEWRTYTGAHNDNSITVCVCSGCSCTGPLTGDLTSSACIYRCVISNVFAMATRQSCPIARWLLSSL